MGQFSKKWEDLEFSDNYIFCKVMHDKHLCKQLLEILLQIEVSDIEYLDTEHTIDAVYDSRGIRMDVFVKDSDRVFNIEMQTGDYDDLLLRARYYQSACDIASTPRRTKFKELKETFILFICKDDPFGMKLPVYTEQKCFWETKEVLYDDKTKKVFYNASAFDSVEDANVKDVLQFIYTLKAESSFTKELETSVVNAKAKLVFKDEYMYFADILEDEKEEARATGLAEGRAKGLAEGRATGLAEGRATGLAEGESKSKHEMMLNMIKEDLSEEIIVRCTNLPLETVHAEVLKYRNS